MQTRQPDGRFGSKRHQELGVQAGTQALGVLAGTVFDEPTFIPRIPHAEAPIVIDETGRQGSAVAAATSQAPEPPVADPLPATGWQPMVNAPKDKPILLFGFSNWTSKSEVAVGHWRGSCWFVIGDTMLGEPTLQAIDPTCWCPIPSPPSATEAARLTAVAASAAERERELAAAAEKELLGKLHRASLRAAGQQSAVDPASLPNEPPIGVPDWLPPTAPNRRLQAARRSHYLERPKPWWPEQWRD